MRADVSIWTEEDEYVVIRCFFLVGCVFRCARAGVVDQKMSRDVCMDEVYIRYATYESGMSHMNEACHT